MTLLDAPTSARQLKPGSTGWTARDLDDPAIERQWFLNRYEIISGVVATMSAAYFTGGEASQNLVYLLSDHLRKSGIRGGFAPEPDIVLAEDRVVRADCAYLSPQDKQRQKAAAVNAGKADTRRARLLIPPTLVIESVSPGHEQHDRVLKRSWYAEFGVPNYWLLDVFSQTLECLILESGTYRIDVSGREGQIIRPAAFPGIVLPLAEVWDADM